jgi:hypothetical protein
VRRGTPFVLLASAFAFTAAVALSGPTHCTPSALWGLDGEKWQPEVTLPDFSYAGYHAGEAPIPSPTVRYDLKRDFHAEGDGRTDDTGALENALRSIEGGVLSIPEGTYVITRKIQISKGNLVLRGAGRGRTVLLFPHSFTDVYGNKPSNGQSQWSFGPGFINAGGPDPITPATRLAAVTAPANRGERTLALSGPVSIQPGEWIRLVESDPPYGNPAAGSLIRFLYGDLMPPGPDLIGTRLVVRFLSRVSSASGTRIVLERALPYDVRPEWTPEIHRFAPTVEELGIEHLSIRFPWTPYPGHFREQGFNAIGFDGVAHGWIDDVEIENADWGIGLYRANFCTIRNVTLRASASRAVEPASRGWNGHHGIDVGHGSENLITDFDVQTKFVHDISVEWYALHTVYARGRGVDLDMDHHREANYASLFTDLDCGDGTRPFASGGSSDRGAHSGARSTFWNIRARSPLLPPPADFGPLLNLIGVDTDRAPSSDYRWTVELVRSSRLCPADLYEAMREHRLHSSR